MPYVKNDPPWVNGGAPGISAERLNHMETQYDEAKADLETAKVAGHGGEWNSDMVDGCHAGTAPNNVLKLDSAGKVPTGNLPGAGVFNFAGDGPYAGTYLARTTSDSDNNVWLTVGPTGSGATVIWTALDAVPAGARAVRINLFAQAWHGSVSAGTHRIWAAVRKVGSAVEPSPSVEAYANAVDEVSMSRNTVDVVLDSSRRFQLKWQKTARTGAGGLGVYLYLEGWYA